MPKPAIKTPPPSPESAPTAEARAVTSGAMIVYVDARGERHPAMILRPYPDHDTIDLSYYPASGYPESVPKVDHDPSGSVGSWHFESEAPRRKPTLDEVLEAAEARGEQVPRPFLTVAYLEANRGAVHHTTVVRRARVLAVRGLDSVDLEIFDGDRVFGEPDEPVNRYNGVPRCQGEPSRAGHKWAFVDDVPLGTRFDPIPVEELRAPWPCDGCSLPTKFHELTAVTIEGRERRLCPSCAASFRLAATPAPA